MIKTRCALSLACGLLLALCAFGADAARGPELEPCEGTTEYPGATVLTAAANLKTTIEGASAGTAFLLGAGTYNSSTTTQTIVVPAANILVKPHNCADVTVFVRWQLGNAADGTKIRGMKLRATGTSSVIETSGDDADNVVIANNDIDGANLGAIRVLHRALDWLIEGNDWDNNDGATCSGGGAVRIGTGGTGRVKNFTLRNNKGQDNACEDGLQFDKWAGTWLIEDHEGGFALAQQIDVKSPAEDDSTLIIRRSKFPNNTGDGGAATLLIASSAAVPEWPPSTKCFIEFNEFRDVQRQISHGGGGEPGGPCVFRYNLHVGAGAADPDTATEAIFSTNGVSDDEYYHNTFIDSEIRVASGGGHTWKNNIYSGVRFTLTGTPIAVCPHNLVSAQQGTGYPAGCTNTQTGDPLLAAPNYTITSHSSPALNNGVNVGLPFNGAAPTIGVFDPLRYTAGNAECGSVNATTTIITFTNNVASPIAPATGITGFTLEEENPPSTWNPLAISAAVRQGTSQVKLTNAACTTGRALRFSYAPGNLTDSILVGNSINQPRVALTNQTVTNNVGGGAPSYEFVASNFRFYQLHAVSGSLVPVGAPNANIEAPPGARFVLAIQTDGINADPPSLAVKPRYSKNSGADTAIPDTAGADHIKMYGLGDLRPTVPTHGGFSIADCLAGSLTAVAGTVVRTSAAIPNFDLAQNQCITHAWIAEIGAGATPGHTYDFPLYADGGASRLDPDGVVPRVTIRNHGAAAM